MPLYRYRSSAARDGRNDRQPEAGVRMAPGHDHRQADRGVGQGGANPWGEQRMDDADQGPHRHAVDRHQDADRRQGFRQGPDRDREAGQADRVGRQDCPRNHECLCGAGDGRLLPRHRT